MQLDETFLQECLAELKSGETVTIRVPRTQRRKVRAYLLTCGATDDDLMRLHVESEPVR